MWSHKYIIKEISWEAIEITEARVDGSLVQDGSRGGGRTWPHNGRGLKKLLLAFTDDITERKICHREYQGFIKG